MLVLILYASFSIRLGYWYYPQNNFIFWLIYFSPIIAIAIFTKFGLYRSVTRYVGFHTLWSIVQGVSLYCLIWIVIVFLARVEDIPRSVVLINWALAILVAGGIRMIARWLLTKENIFQKKIQTGKKRKKVLIYGAGLAGVQLVGALSHSSEYTPVGFVDDLKEVQGTEIWGLNVYPIDRIGELIDKLKVNEVLIAMPTVSRARRFNIVTSLEPYPIQVRMLPSMTDLAGGKVSVDDLHEVSIEDLLGRDTVPANPELLNKNITNKVIVVTGAGGSIGSELCSQIYL